MRASIILIIGVVATSFFGCKKWNNFDASLSVKPPRMVAKGNLLSDRFNPGIEINNLSKIDLGDKLLCSGRPASVAFKINLKDGDAFLVKSIPDANTGNQFYEIDNSNSKCFSSRNKGYVGQISGPKPQRYEIQQITSSDGVIHFLVVSEMFAPHLSSKYLDPSNTDNENTYVRFTFFVAGNSVIPLKHTLKMNAGATESFEKVIPLNQVIDPALTRNLFPDHMKDEEITERIKQFRDEVPVDFARIAALKAPILEGARVLFTTPVAQRKIFQEAECDVIDEKRLALTTALNRVTAMLAISGEALNRNIVREGWTKDLLNLIESYQQQIALNDISAGMTQYSGNSPHLSGHSTEMDESANIDSVVESANRIVNTIEEQSPPNLKFLDRITLFDAAMKISFAEQTGKISSSDIETFGGVKNMTVNALNELPWSPINGFSKLDFWRLKSDYLLCKQ